MALSEKDKMLSGQPYRPGDPQLQAEMAAAKAWMNLMRAPQTRELIRTYGYAVK